MPAATSTDPMFLNNLSTLRHQIDEIDEEMLTLLGERMKLAKAIGDYKRVNNIAILQPERWQTMLAEAQNRGAKRDLSPEFIADFLKAIHQESINKQEFVIRKAGVES